MDRHENLRQSEGRVKPLAEPVSLKAFEDALAERATTEAAGTSRGELERVEPPPFVKPTPEVNKLRHPRLDFSRVPGHYRRGGGAKTPGGRAKASQNALSHGGYSAPSSDRARLAEISQGLQDQYRPSNTYQRLLVEQLANAFWALSRMNELVAQGLDLSATWQPKALALGARVDFPWPEHAHELLELPERHELQRELARFFQRLLSFMSTLDPHKLTQQGAIKLIRQAAVCFASKLPVLEFDRPEFWRHLDKQVAGMRFKGHGHTTRHTLSTRQVSASHPLLQLDGAAAGHGVRHTSAAQANEAAADLDRGARAYWLFRNQARVHHERLGMINERHLAMLGDPNASRAQSHHLKRIATLERQILESQLKPWTQTKA